MPAAELPSPIFAQLQAVLAQDAAADRVALVWPEPVEPAESRQAIGSTQMHVVYCPSELAIRERLVRHRGGSERLVILSPFDETRLGKDVLARLWSNEPKRVSPWRTLEQLLRVNQIDPRLTGKEYRWIAECLVSSYDRYRGRVAFGEVLDFDKAWEALAFALLDYREATIDLESLLAWSLVPKSSEMIASLPSEVKNHLGDWLEPRLNETADLIQTLWLADKTADMVAIGLVCDLLYSQGSGERQEVFQARGRLTERFLAGARIHNDVLRRFGEAASAFVSKQLRNGNRALVTSQITRAEQHLASLDMRHLAVESDLLFEGYGQRLDAFSAALAKSVKGGVSATTLGLLKAIECHQLADVRREQVKTAQHAVRICQWLHSDSTIEAGPSKQIRQYVAEGGFIDWSRSRIWAGDEHEGLSRAYQAISRQVRTRRESVNEAFSAELKAIARGDTLAAGIWPVESALESLVAPLAKQHPVLLLVLDGMSQAVYRELAEDLTANHWVELQPTSCEGAACLASALPSITQVSRYSLLAGRLGQGNSADEKKAFASNSALRSLASTKFPPVLYHKADLQQPGSGGLAPDVRSVISGQEHRIVAAVINAIDDQLSSNAQLSVEWRVTAIRVLHQVLEAARESGRIVILTSDHGHVLDHDMLYRKSDADTERFKPGNHAIDSGEVLVEGPRVVQPDNRAVVAWSETLRYAMPKMGYHGGGSLQEVVIPVGVFRDAGETEEIAGWHEVPRQYPAWWRFDTTSGVAEVVPKEVTPRKRPSKQKKAASTGDLFDSVQKEPAPVKHDDWVGQLLKSPVYTQMKARAGRSAVADDALRGLLQALEAKGGQQMLSSLAQAIGMPVIRMNGFLAGAQKLLNVDGYAVLTVDRSSKTVKLNMESLRAQFEL